MLGRLHNSIVRLTGTFRTAGRARCLSETGGSEPIPKMDHRHMGPKGAGDQPYAKPPPKQDGPPPGGFGNVRFQRHSTTVPNVPTAVILGGAAFAMIYGFYQIGETNKETRARKKEKKTARENLGAFLQAEEDQLWVKRQEVLLAREAELMKDVPGWKVGESVYHSKRWMPPIGNERHYTKI